MKMKYNRLIPLCLLASWLALPALAQDSNADALLKNNGIPNGRADEVLPQNAILHIQLQSLYQTLVNVETLAKSLVPEKALPPEPELQEIMKSDHPLMTLLGMQTFGAPLTEELVAEKLGLRAGEPISITVYPGIPRPSIVLALPTASPETMTGILRAILRPEAMEEADLGGKKAVRIALAGNQFVPELYAVCSETMVYLCSDRGLALSLHNAPHSERLAQDAFLQKAKDRMGKQDFTLIFNPGVFKPFLLSLQQFRPLLMPLLQQQRERLLSQVPPEIKSRIEMQLRTNFGVKDLNEFADFAECFLMATLDQINDNVVKNLVSFEGICLTAQFDPHFPKLGLFVHSSQIQTASSTQAIPLSELKQTLGWLGKDFDSFQVTGRTPNLPNHPGLLSWVQAVKKQIDVKGLKSIFFDKFESLVQNQAVSQPVSARVPWMLTTSATLAKAPAIRDYPSLEKYLNALAQQGFGSVRQAVRIVPGQGIDFLKQCFEEDTQALVRNEQLGRDFAKDVFDQTAWFEKTGRFSAQPQEAGVTRLTLENVFLTHGGIFGYDQHELINRRIFLARELDGYLVYHQGGRNTSWLANLHRRPKTDLAPATVKLLDRVPEGANYFRIDRILNRLPAGLGWLQELEARIHGDLQAYVDKANDIVKSAASLDEAMKELNQLKMPELVFALNREAQSGRMYCLLPGNLVFPRPQVVPLLQELIADYVAKSDQVGGCLVYTRVQPETYELACIQSTEGLAAFIKSLGNTMAGNYLGSWEKQQNLQQRIMAKDDVNPNRLDEVLIRNPRWEFIPGPQARKPAKPTQEIPSRESSTDSKQIDLSSCYNASLTESWHGGGIANNTLADLPRGVQEFGGVKFDVRGLIQVSGKSAEAQLTVKFPKEVKDIKVGQSAHKLHFLHATGWQAPDGTRIGTYVVHYANGDTREIPILYGRQVRDWWVQQNEAQNDELNVVWTGKNTSNTEGATQVRLFKSTWENPQPDTQIESIDFRSDMADPAPFLIAITAE